MRDGPSLTASIAPRRWALTAILAAIAFAAAAAGQPRTSTAQVAANVEIQGFAFVPATVTVAVGAPVTWTNRDAAPHTATASAFDSGTLLTGQSYTFTPRLAGTFAYRCDIHPDMRGTLVVVSGAPGSPTAPAGGGSASITPNGGVWASGANQAVVQGGGAAAAIAQTVASTSGRAVSAIWYLAGGAWTYHLPAFPSISGGLTNLPGPVASVFVILA